MLIDSQNIVVLEFVDLYQIVVVLESHFNL